MELSIGKELLNKASSDHEPTRSTCRSILGLGQSTSPKNISIPQIRNKSNKDCVSGPFYLVSLL
jgi:hypothetical protein